LLSVVISTSGWADRVFSDHGRRSERLNVTSVTNTSGNAAPPIQSRHKPDVAARHD
jgi:hypothetical protein